MTKNNTTLWSKIRIISDCSPGLYIATSENIFESVYKKLSKHSCDWRIYKNHKSCQDLFYKKNER